MRLVHTLALVAAVSTLSGIASATSFSSDSSTTSYTGYNASSSASTSTVSQGTYTLGNGGTSADALTGSSWVSSETNSEPNGSVALPGSPAAGLNYFGAVATPEPGSLMLLGAGLLAGASTLLHRHRRA